MMGNIIVRNSIKKGEKQTVRVLNYGLIGMLDKEMVLLTSWRLNNGVCHYLDKTEDLENDSTDYWQRRTKRVSSLPAVYGDLPNIAGCPTVTRLHGS